MGHQEVLHTLSGREAHFLSLTLRTQSLRLDRTAREVRVSETGRAQFSATH